MIDFKVKVCGITRLGDAKAAVKYGADMLGFIFYRKSPRSISVKKAEDIICGLSPVIQLAGVFVNEKTDYIIRIGRRLRLGYIQLSGDESRRDIRILKKAGFKVIKTFRPKTSGDFKKILNSEADIVHLDNADKNQYGGSGRRFDWSIKLPAKMDNLMLAGGINVDNVASGVKLYRPLIVDVNSGVEFKPGLKSDKKLKDFFNKCDSTRYGRKK